MLEQAGLKAEVEAAMAKWEDLALRIEAVAEELGAEQRPEPSGLHEAGRVDGAKASEPLEIAVACHPVAVVLDGQGGVVGVGDELAARARGRQQVTEQPPMLRTWAKLHAAGGGQQGVEERQRLSLSRRRGKGFRSSHNAKEAREDKVGPRQRGRASLQRPQAAAVQGMLAVVDPKPGNQHVDVAHPHQRLSASR